MENDICLPFDPNVEPPRQRLPGGSCDCHIHFFQDAARFPYAQGRSYTPAAAPVAAYRSLMQSTGISRAVLVQPSVYGNDHGLFVETLRQSSDWLRGVAVARANTTERDLERWHTVGARGARANLLFGAGASLGEVEAIVERIRPFGWHLQVCMDVDAMPDLLPRIVDMDVSVVVDHMGHLPAAQASSSRGFANLLALLHEGSVWSKLSGPYRLTPQRKGFEDVRFIVDRLIESNPSRLVWGSDWPHPSIAAPMVNDTDLVNAALDWLRDEELRDRILVANPNALYWADSAPL